VKAGWEIRTLGDACSFIDYRGRTPQKVDDGLRLITAKNVKMGFLQKEPLEYVDPATYGGWMTRGIPRIGDVLFTTEAPLANVAQLDTDERVVFAQRIIVLQPVGKDIDATFLKYFLMSDSAQRKILQKGTGATVQGIKASLLKKIEISFPKLAGQHRIVKILDEAFENIATAKANAEKNLQNARALFESHLQSIFNQTGDDWINNRIQDVCQIRPPKSEARGIVQSFEHVSFVPMEDLCIGEKYARASKTRPLSEVDGSYTYFAEGDVLLAKITPCFENGKLGIARNLERGIGFGSSEFIVFRPNSLLCNEWLYYFLRRERFRLEGAAQMAGAVGQKRVIKEFIENCLIPVPPISEQRRLVETLDSLVTETRRLESIYQAKIAALDELKKSLLHQAFNGDL